MTQPFLSSGGLESDKCAALLLTSIAEIASKEFDINCKALEERDANTHALFEERVRKISIDFGYLSESRPKPVNTGHLKYSHKVRNRKAVTHGRKVLQNNCNDTDWHAIVSDSSLPNSPMIMPSQPDTNTNTVLTGLSSLVSETPGCSKPLRERRSSFNSKESPRLTSTQPSMKSIKISEACGIKSKTILRRKFSWKHYPEVRIFHTLLV